jgi:hypothetical protein
MPLGQLLHGLGAKSLGWILACEPQHSFNAIPPLVSRYAAIGAALSKWRRRCSDDQYHGVAGCF